MLPLFAITVPHEHNGVRRFLCSKRISVANQSKQWHQANHDLQPALCAGKRVPVCPEYQSPIVFRLIPILLWSLDWKPLKSAFKFTSDVCSSPDSVMVLSRCSTVCISRSTSCISRALSVLSCWISLLSWTICKKKRKFWILYWNAILDDLRQLLGTGKRNDGQNRASQKCKVPMPVPILFVVFRPISTNVPGSPRKLKGEEGNVSILNAAWAAAAKARPSVMIHT